MHSKGALKTSYIAIAVIIIIVIAAIAIYFTTMPAPTPTTPTPITPTPTPTTPTTPKPTPTPTTPAMMVWRWAVPDPGSMGYRITTWPTYILMQKMPKYTFIILPYSATAAAIKGFCKGESETVWAGCFGMMQLYTFTGPYEGFKPEVKKMPAASWFATTTVIFFLTTPEKAKEIRSWKDLDGRNVFLGPSGYVTHQTIKYALEKMGIKVNHIEMSTGMAAEALRKGTIDACYMYGSTSLPTWGKELDIAIDVVAINPTSEEMKMIENAGFAVGVVDAKKLFTQDVGMDKIYGLNDPWGYWTGLDIPEDDVYNMLKILEENVKELKDPEYDYIRGIGFAEWQREGVKATVGYGVGIKIHPGLAKYLKEKEMWDPKWDQWIAK
jgi:TRAP-type uncharacterized transport system substrate-binding protein